MKRGDRVRFRQGSQWGTVIRTYPSGDIGVAWDVGFESDAPPEALKALREDSEHQHHWVPKGEAKVGDERFYVQACACGASYRMGEVNLP